MTRSHLLAAAAAIALLGAVAPSGTVQAQAQGQGQGCDTAAGTTTGAGCPPAASTGLPATPHQAETAAGVKEGQDSSHMATTGSGGAQMPATPHQGGVVQQQGGKTQ